VRGSRRRCHQCTRGRRCSCRRKSRRLRRCRLRRSGRRSRRCRRSDRGRRSRSCHCRCRCWCGRTCRRGCTRAGRRGGARRRVRGPGRRACGRRHRRRGRGNGRGGRSIRRRCDRGYRSALPMQVDEQCLVIVHGGDDLDTVLAAAAGENDGIRSLLGPNQRQCGAHAQGRITLYLHQSLREKIPSSFGILVIVRPPRPPGPGDSPVSRCRPAPRATASSGASSELSTA
jgi:hypothetical protein